MSCDAELQELMIQVDRMVEDKKLEWQEKIKNTENKLHAVLQENFNLKSIIEDKNTEIANFKNQIKYKDNMSNIFDYDQEVLQVRLELSQIKKSYEKYYHKYTKKSKEMEKDKEDLYKEKIELLKEINDLRNSQKQYNVEKNYYQEQLREFELKKNHTIVDREALNEQLKLLKADFNLQLNNYVESERKYSEVIKELETKLNETKISLQNEVEQNRIKLSDITQHLKRALEEKQQVIKDNESAKRMIIRLENELTRFSTENKNKEKIISKMEQVIKVSEKTINEKNEVIKALQGNSASKDYVTTVTKFENELLDAKSQLKLYKKNEKSYQVDIQTLQKKLKEANELIANEQNLKNQLESNLEKTMRLESEKCNMKDKILNFEAIIEGNSLEISSLKTHLERIKEENEKLMNELHLNKMKDVKMSGRAESRKTNQDEIHNYKSNLSTESIVKERNYLLRFCEDKDMIIHRLQMENRVFQEFISKLNCGLSGDLSFFNTDMNIDNTESDVFQPLKETFTEFDPSMGLDKSEESSHQNNLHSSQPPSLRLPSKYHQPADQISNYCKENLRTSINKSSEDFLSKLIRSESGENNNPTDSDSFMNIYPTLAAAKYFTDEREKTKQIEEMIDFHMDQLKKTTETKLNISSNH